MRKVLNKHQIQVIMVLNAVLVILFCGVIFVNAAPAADLPTGGGNTEVPPPHNLIRAARVSANDVVDWEINIGGTKDETLVAAYVLNNRIFIFGNTASTDLDFVGGGSNGFAAELMPSGNTKRFITFPFTLVKVLPAGKGFALAGNDEKGGVLCLTDSDCTVIGTANLDPTHSQTVIDLLIYDELYFVVADAPNENVGINKIMLTAYDAALKLRCVRLFSRAYSLSYVSVLPYSGRYVLAANVTTATGDTFLTLGVFDTISQPTFTDKDMDFAYVVRSFSPYEKGYAALIDRGGKPEFLLLNTALNETYSKYIGVVTCMDSDLFFTGGNFYAYMHLTADESRLIRYDGALDKETAIAEGNDLSSLFGTTANGAAAFALGSTADSLKLIGLSAGGTIRQQRFASANETNGIAVALADSILVVAESTAKSADVGGNFGGKDIWIAKILLR